VEADALLGLTWPVLRARAFAAATDSTGLALGDLLDLAGRPEWEPQFFAVCALGALAATDGDALDALRAIASTDLDWRVNEGLAFGFDAYCAGAGYEETVPEIRRWLASAYPNQRRAACEGLRRWTDARRAYFHDNPGQAVALLSLLRADPSPYVRRSLGNALRDIWRAHPALVEDTVAAWIEQAPDSREMRGIAKLALRAAGGAPPATVV
jgi:hypothetical protein